MVQHRAAAYMMKLEATYMTFYLLYAAECTGLASVVLLVQRRADRLEPDLTRVVCSSP